MFNLFKFLSPRVGKSHPFSSSTGQGFRPHYLDLPTSSLPLLSLGQWLWLYIWIPGIALVYSLPLGATELAAMENVTLQLKWKHQFQFAGYYAAQWKGFYQAANLNVKILEAEGTFEPGQAVLQGKADFGIASSDLILLRNQGYPVVALAAIFQHSPLTFLALKSSNIDTIHHLAGKRIMLEPHSAELLAYLKDESILMSTLTIIPHSFDVSALLQGQADVISAYSTDEPFVLQQAHKDYVIFTPRAGGIDFYGDVLFTTQDQLKNHPQRVEAFLEASLKGWEYALDHPDEIINLIYTQYSQRHSREHLAFEAEKTRNLILPDIVEIGYMNPGRWEHIIQVYEEMGMLRSQIPLKNFLYDRSHNANLTWVYLVLAVALGAITLVSGVAARFYQLTRAIQREMAAKETVTKNLEALGKRYRVLVENAPFPIVISRLSDGLLLYVNPSAAQKFEVAQDHAIGKSSSEYYVNPENRDSLILAVERQGYVQNMEILFKSATGQTFWANLSATLISFENEPAIFVELVDVTQQKELERQLEILAMTDELTGLFNRRYFTHKGSEAFQRAWHDQTDLSVIMLDIDRFKSINDTYGHDAGDEILKNVAGLISKSLRQIDIPSRVGGEEFALLLPDRTHDDAGAIAEGLRCEIEQHLFEVNGQVIPLTVSMGIASLTRNSASLRELLNQADIALYQAKQSGRNCVICYSH